MIGEFWERVDVLTPEQNQRLAVIAVLYGTMESRLDISSATELVEIAHWVATGMQIYDDTEPAPERKCTDNERWSPAVVGNRA